MGEGEGKVGLTGLLHCVTIPNSQKWIKKALAAAREKVGGPLLIISIAPTGLSNPMSVAWIWQSRPSFETILTERRESVKILAIEHLVSDAGLKGYILSLSKESFR